MRQFNITVNGASYLVSVEEVSGAPVAYAPAPVAAAPVAAPAPAPAAPVAPPAAAPAAIAGGEAVVSPMPGTILDIKVKEGDAVKKGDLLLILEAMKMENEILAPVDGVVKQVVMSKGASVNSGDALVVIG